MKSISILILAVCFLFSACAAPVQPASTPLETSPSLTTPAAEISTTVPAATQTETSLNPYVPFFVTNTVENLVLRANPGYLFEAKTTLAPDTRLLVLGRAPGNEWIFVQTPFERTGWVFAQLLDPNSNYNLAPLIQPADMQVARGQVLDQAGNPISGIQFAFVQGTSGSPPRNDAITDTHGVFYAFMPLTASGTWTVSFTAVACTSNTMDPNCQCISGKCGKPDPEVTSISLPSDTFLKFTWK